MHQKVWQKQARQNSFPEIKSVITLVQSFTHLTYFNSCTSTPLKCPPVVNTSPSLTTSNKTEKNSNNTNSIQATKFPLFHFHLNICFSSDAHEGQGLEKRTRRQAILPFSLHKVTEKLKGHQTCDRYLVLNKKIPSPRSNCLLLRQSEDDSNSLLYFRV